MAISIKNTEEIGKMRIAGKMAADLLIAVESIIKPGISTQKIDEFCHNYIIERDAIPAPLNYRGFPKSVCTSVNHVICHGIPSASQILKNGDIINVDVTVKKDGYHGDTSKMFLVGDKVPDYAKKLIKVTKECLQKSMDILKPGVNFGQIGIVIQQHAEQHGYFVVRDFCGHGIGSVFHEEPQILHYQDKDCKIANIKIEAGMIFTIEPMINESVNPKNIIASKVLGDDWTAITADKNFEKKFNRKALSAQWEHTILVTDTGYEILTARQ